LKLYHFTAADLLPQIMEEGLSRGDVPITQTASYKAVWLTSLLTPIGHGLGQERELTDREKAIIGAPRDRPVFMMDKRRIRIEVVIPRGDRNLHRWDRWSKKHLAPSWRDALHGAGGHSYRTWFIYNGIIPPAWFSKVEDLKPDRIAA